MSNHTPNKTSIYTTWNLESSTYNMCPLYQVIVTCISEDEVWWVKNYSQTVHNVSTDSRPTSVSINILDLSPFTNYTCSGIVVNSGGNSDASEVDLRTLEDGKGARAKT